MSNLFTTMLTRPVVRRRNARRLDEGLPPNGVRDARFVTVGGIPQWLTIRGQDRNNPILFFLHGGPGMGHTMHNAVLTAWERHFTLVQWDQRGSGKTRRRNGPLHPGELTLDRLEADAAELAEWLLVHLGHTKLILIASSAGSTFGLALAHHRPDLLHAYVGTDQNIGADTLRLSHQHTLDWLRHTGNPRLASDLDAFGTDPRSWTTQQTDRLARYAVKANPTVPNMINDIILPALLTSPEHTLRDLRDTIAGATESMTQWHDQVNRYDAFAIGKDFTIPAFILQGDGDLVTPAAAAANYLERVSAPHKELILIKNSGHLAMFADTELFLDTLVRRVRPLTATDNAHQK